MRGRDSCETRCDPLCIRQVRAVEHSRTFSYRERGVVKGVRLHDAGRRRFVKQNPARFDLVRSIHRGSDACHDVPPARRLSPEPRPKPARFKRGKRLASVRVPTRYVHGLHGTLSDAHARVGVSVVHGRSGRNAHYRHRFALVRGKKLADFERDRRCRAILNIACELREHSSQRRLQTARMFDSFTVVFASFVSHQTHTSHTIRCYPHADPHVLPLHA